MTDPDRFPSPGRYAGLEIATLPGPDGAPRPYLRRRLLDPLAVYPVVDEHVVADGDRLDLLAARYFHDPTRFWLLCDAHAVLDPLRLTADIGRVLRITQPPGPARRDHDG